MQKSSPKKNIHPLQQQSKPGKEKLMHPKPVFDFPDKPGYGRLKDKIAIITGGDSGIGKAVAVLFAKEGADICISYLNEHKDAKETKEIVESYGRNCLTIAGDISKEIICKKILQRVKKEYGRIDVLINNAAIQFEQKSVEDISTKQLMTTFATNIFSYFWFSKYALPMMKKGSCIINTTSVTAYRGSAQLIDYSATKGAIVSFTRSLAHNLVDKGIRVNGVAPGPIWTPLIADTFDAKKVARHGSDAPMHRAGEPVEVAPSYLFLATEDSSYITGQIIHPNGGEIING